MLHGPVRRTASWLLLAALSASPPLLAQGASTDELARRHFESGTAYLQESDYENALKAFQKSYQLSERPVILLNVATVQERMADLKGAIATLERYLEAAPKADNRKTIELRIENLKKRLPKEEPDAPRPGGEPGLEPEPAQDPAPAPEPTPEPAPADPEVESAGPGPLPYVLLGVGGLSLGGALLTGILASSEHSNAESTCAPNCSDDELSTGRTMALTSTILTGVGVVGVGIGAVLLLGGGNDHPEASSKPRVQVSLGPSGAAAAASWRF